MPQPGRRLELLHLLKTDGTRVKVGFDMPALREGALHKG